MRKIELSKGKVTWVDEADWDWLMQWKWCAMVSRSGNWYAVRGEGRHGPTPRTFLMHREILKAPPGITVDHWDNDGLHNWKKNLRFATRSEQQQNRSVILNRHGYKGIKQRGRRWSAKVVVRGEERRLGTFDTAEEAALAYNAAALKFFGAFAHLNIVNGRI